MFKIPFIKNDNNIKTFNIKAVFESGLSPPILVSRYLRGCISMKNYS